MISIFNDPTRNQSFCLCVVSSCPLWSYLVSLALSPSLLHLGRSHSDPSLLPGRQRLGPKDFNLLPQLVAIALEHMNLPSSAKQWYLSVLPKLSQVCCLKMVSQVPPGDWDH